MAKVDYKVILDEAWQQHLAQRELDAPTVISTFAGCGGSSLGYSMAGYRELLAVEWDDNAVETFKLNFPEIPVYHGDIANLSVKECCELAEVETGALDILDGSPPCQGFSTAGKRNMDDDRNQLFREYVRLLRGLKPKAFIMENVSGMVKGKMKLIFAECLRELKTSGYHAKAWLINAMYFNVPQSRQRMIFIGIREDFETIPIQPKSIDKPRCALCAIKGIDNSENHYRPRRFNTANRHLKHHHPSPTLLKTDIATGSDMPFAGSQRIGSQSAAIIASFPDKFLWAGTWQNAMSRIGNSVPPLFMRAIAKHVKTEILERMTQLGCECEVK